MIERLLNFIRRENLFNPGQDRVLLAVSGGMDSVVMADLFYKADLMFAMAHANFGLRGEESKADEAFVRKLAKRYGVPVYIENFDVKGFAKDNKLSTQEAARSLRYQWFNQLLEEEQLAYLATAHHQDDEVETILYNLTKGAGIAGIRGMRPKVNRTVRPLLFAGREDIFAYLTEHQLAWREDSTNQSDRYVRNQIRHQVIPVLKEINPGLEKTVSRNAARVRGVEDWLQDELDLVKSRVLTKREQEVYIHIPSLKEERSMHVKLEEILREFSFSGEEIEKIISVLDKQPGKRFFSSTHQLVKDREYLVVTLRETMPYQARTISINTQELETGEYNLFFKWLNREGFTIDPSPDTACLELQESDFPLKLRRWQEGDWFCPLGMNKKKKLSDFLTDQKLPLHKKEKTDVITAANGSVVWVVGHRIDNRFKVKKKGGGEIVYIKKEDK